MLSQKYYCDESFFASERESLFSRKWICVGHESDLTSAGNYQVVDFFGDQIILLRSQDQASGDGSIRAFYNVCRHRGTQLLESTAGNCKAVVRCPYHGWSYSFDGQLIAAPNMDDSFECAEFSLKQIKCAVWNGLIFLSENPDATLDSFLAPLSALVEPYFSLPLIAAEKVVYQVNANWKLIFQNYSECYHCPCVHPQLTRLTPFRANENDISQGPILGGPMKIKEGSESLSMDGLFVGKPFEDLSTEQRGLVYYYTIFPSLFLSPHPDYVLLHLVKPVAVNKTEVTCLWLFPQSVQQQDGFSAGGAKEFWDVTNRQDWEMCERSQLGIESRGFEPGPYSELESLLPEFDAYYMSQIQSGH